MLLLLVRKIEKDHIWNLGEKTPVCFLLLLTIGLYGSAQILNTPIVTVYRFGIYVFHYLPLAMTAYYLNKFELKLSAFIVYLFVGISAFAGALLLNETISRIPIIRWCVLGIQKNKNI